MAVVSLQSFSAFFAVLALYKQKRPPGISVMDTNILKWIYNKNIVFFSTFALISGFKTEKTLLPKSDIFKQLTNDN